jgi:hypothetical protein
MLRVVIVQDLDGVALEDTNDGSSEVGCTVIAIHACSEVRPCGSGEKGAQQ